MCEVRQFDTGILEKFTIIEIASAISFSYFDRGKKINL